MSSKRPVKTSGDTPGKPKAKRSLTRGTRKSLFSHKSEKKIPSLVPETNSEWTTKELQGLVQYIALYNPLQTSNQWPTTKYKAFWSNCAEAVQQYSRKSIRTGNACRAKALRLKDKFSTIEEAEEKLNIDYFENEGEGIKQTSETLKTPKGYKCPESCLSPVFACSPSRRESKH
ncbi:uncharacterized protein LOC114576071 [Exaiptasia diaphana]|uniref:Myb-like domain-containing protein n=1 Tax=Exaiptasia diaphana TaxID=2652724 RepID=A0A913YQY8_EXADI|nr:uncharacterized protein LOC114576071 [Exaiptasia diaphana]XP_028517920.1 uncharacterized protein LOC114576071 [Exaiptasia diaphana]